MGRWLAPRLPGPQRWVVHDRDDGLLELAVADPPEGVAVETRRSDITRLAPEDLAGASVVVASALLDLLTGDELAAVLRACAGRPMLLALTVTGRVAPRPGGPARRAPAKRRSTPTSGAIAGSARTPSPPPPMPSAGQAPRCSSGRARGASMPPTPA